MSIAKDLLLEEWEAREEPTPEEQFEDALAREDDRDRRNAHSPVRRELRLVIDNERR